MSFTEPPPMKVPTGGWTGEELLAEEAFVDIGTGPWSGLVTLQRQKVEAKKEMLALV